MCSNQLKKHVIILLYIFSCCMYYGNVVDSAKDEFLSVEQHVLVSQQK